MKIAVVTDSNAGILREEEEKFSNLHIIPMPFMIDDEEYFEGVNLSQTDFYQKLAEGAEVSTSQPSIGVVLELWEKLLKEYDAIVHIAMSSGLSKSCETAMNFARDFEGRVQVIDNRRVSVTHKQSVFDALNLAKEGRTAREIKEMLEDSASDSTIYIMVSTLKYLKKGGRITPTAAAIGTLLNIKPVLTIQGGKLDSHCKVMNEKVAKLKMIDAVKKDIQTRFAPLVEKGQMNMYVAHTNCPEKAEAFAEQLREEFPNIPLSFIDPLALSIACHIGSGSIAVAMARTF